jgi:hypothetical protein
VSKNSSTSIIEINGKRYDAVTGQLIGAVKRVARQVKPAVGVIDGFVRRPSGRKTTNQTIRSAPQQRHVQNIQRQPQKSQTLMRRAVARYTQVLASNDNPRPKARSTKLRPSQTLRAKTVAQNDKVNRFGNPLNTAKAIMKNTPLVGQVITRPTALTAPQSGVVAASTQAMPSLVASVSPRNLERLLDEALTRADYHKDMIRRQLAGNSLWGRIKLMPRWLSIGVSSLVVLLLGSFFAWQNIPQVSMRLATNEAHVSASIPSYTPVGFAIAVPVSHTNKAVTIEFKSSEDSSQTFSITQQASNWDSSTLAASVGAKSDQVQTSNGTTVYIYGANNNASWVNRGVLHTLSDQAGLSSDQIRSIADSMQ